MERRTSPRILTEFPLVLSDEKGAIIDARALARDVSDRGFQVETSGELVRGQPLSFALGVDAALSLRGRGRTVWVERSPPIFRAGVEFVSLSWSDRRLLRRLCAPSPGVLWSEIVDKALMAVVLMTVVMLIWNVLSSRFWREILRGLAPRVVAIAALGWALREFLRSRR